MLKAFEKCSSDKEKLSKLLTTISSGGTSDNDDFKEILFCVTKAAGFLSDDDRLLIDKTAALFPDKEYAKKLLTECGNDMGSKPVDNLSKSLKCFQKKSKYLISL